MPSHLDYLLFDATDEESGSCSFDAMASVAPDRLPALLHEVEAVLDWAVRGFGAPAAGGDDGEWDFALQAADAQDRALDIAFDAERARVVLRDGSAGRVTLALTVSGSARFAGAFRDAFPEAD